MSFYVVAWILQSIEMDLCKMVSVIYNLEFKA